MFDFAEATKEMSAVEILNYYRNLYYAEPQVTERGIIANAINDYLTADVVEVVRCADCKYWDAVKNQKYKDTGICIPPRKDLGGYCVRRGATNCNDFCSQGERRKDNAEIH